MQRLCKMAKPWAKYLTWISGLRSFTLHTARCPCRDSPFEGRSKCPTTVPLTAEAIHPFNETHQWTEEDRTNGSAITEWWGEFSKSIMHDQASRKTPLERIFRRACRCLHLSGIQRRSTHRARHRVKRRHPEGLGYSPGWRLMWRFGVHGYRRGRTVWFRRVRMS